jgi:hypothetical protein
LIGKKGNNIDPALRHASQGLFQEPFERLVNGFVNKFYHYAVNHEIRVTEMVSVGWTDQGKKLCEAFGMTQIGADLDGHPIYWVDLASGGPKSRGSMPGMFWKLLSLYDRVAARTMTEKLPVKPSG